MTDLLDYIRSHEWLRKPILMVAWAFLIITSINFMFDIIRLLWSL